MSLLISYLQQILHLLLLVSAIAVVLMVWGFLRKKTGIKTLATIAAILSSVGGLLVGLVNISNPIGVIKSDPAKQVIEQFYGFLPYNTDSAYALVHPGRIEDIRKTVRADWGKDDFKKAYDTTSEYKHLKIELAPESVDGGARFYNVSFDVRDEPPINRLYEMRSTNMKDVFLKGFINETSLVASITANLKEFYEVPAGSDNEIQRYIEESKLQALTDPMFLYGLQLDLSSGIGMRPLKDHPPFNSVWQHFIQRLRMEKDGEVWKIRYGLWPPVAIAEYSPGLTP